MIIDVLVYSRVSVKGNITDHLADDVQTADGNKQLPICGERDGIRNGDVIAKQVSTKEELEALTHCKRCLRLARHRFGGRYGNVRDLYSKFWES
jgi:hypothetical protein